MTTEHIKATKVKEPSQILIINMGGKGNIGDRAMALNDIRLIRQMHPDAKLLVGPHTLDFMLDEFNLQRCCYLSHCYSRWSKVLHPIKNLAWLSKLIAPLLFTLSTLLVFGLVFLKSRLGFRYKWRFMEAELASALVDSNILFFCGGGYFNDVGTLDSRSNLIMAWLAKYADRKVVMSGQGLGPFHTRFSVWLLARVIPRIDAISFRDKFGSEALLQKLNISWRGAGAVGDDAMSLPLKAIDMQDGDEATNQTVLGVNFRISPFTPNLDQKIAEFSQFVAIAGNELNWEIHFFIFETSRPWEEGLIKQLIASSKIQHYKIHKTEDPREALYLTQNCDVAVGISYHFIVFALKLGIPVFALYTGEYYRGKMEGLLAWYDRLHWCVPAATLDAKQLIANCQLELQTSAQHQQYLQTKTQELASHYEQTLASSMILHNKAS